MNTDSFNEKFIALMSEHHRKIYSYILLSVGRRHLADDLMQQTLLLMWRNFSRFEPGTNFAAWGREIAKYEILSFRKKKVENFFWDQDALEKIMDVSERLADTSDQRLDALEGCLKRLSDKNRNLIHYRYNEGYSCLKISQKINCPVSTIYKTLARLHASLQDCIHRTLVIWNSQL